MVERNFQPFGAMRAFRNDVFVTRIAGEISINAISVRISLAD
jgi:hypothetical protein